jgi:hypothetical protein
MLLPALAKAEQSSNEELDKRVERMFCDSLIKVDISVQPIRNNDGDKAHPQNVHDRTEYLCCQMPTAGVS